MDKATIPQTNRSSSLAINRSINRGLIHSNLCFLSIGWFYGIDDAHRPTRQNPIHPSIYPSYPRFRSAHARARIHASVVVEDARTSTSSSVVPFFLSLFVIIPNALAVRTQKPHACIDRHGPAGRPTDRHNMLQHTTTTNPFLPQFPAVQSKQSGSALHGDGHMP